MSLYASDPQSTEARDIVVIGASAGGVEALISLVKSFSADLPAAVFIVLHVPPGSQGLLASILRRNANLPTSFPENGEPIRQRHIYVAPPDKHLLLRRSKIILSSGPTHNRHRPGIDPLFKSAAKHMGRRTIGIILTGFLDDGSEGLAAIQNAGGYTIVQDPKDALVPFMPRHALSRIRPDICLPLQQIGPHINEICRQLLPERNILNNEEESSTPTTITCPECHGVINEIHASAGTRYECQVGHSFTPQGLLDAQSDDLEHALWAAVRSLEEGASLSRKLAEKAGSNNRPTAAKQYRENANHRSQHAKILRELLEKLEHHDRNIEFIENLP